MGAAMFIAHITAKGGRKEYIVQPHATREAAAHELFAARPGANSCATCIAYEAEPGTWRQSHRDIRFHDRWRMA